MHGMLSAAILICVFAAVAVVCAYVAGRVYLAPEDDRGAVAIHPDLAPMAFLLGRWEGAGIGGYPTIESFRFGQEIEFSHNGKPFLSYVSRTWRLDEEGRIGLPLGTESGYWRPRPDNQVEVMLAHPTGIVEIYLGEITGTRIEMATDVVARTATAKEVTAGHRLYGLAGGDLAYAYDMAAMGQPLQPHLSAQLKRVQRGLRAKGIPGRLLPARQWRCAGTDWTRSASPGTRCLPGFSRPPPRWTSCRRVGG